MAILPTRKNKEYFKFTNPTDIAITGRLVIPLNPPLKDYIL